MMCNDEISMKVLRKLLTPRLSETRGSFDKKRVNFPRLAVVS